MGCVRIFKLSIISSVYSVRIRVAEILDSLGANSYHGFIAVFTRMLVEDIKNGDLGKPGKPSIVLGTALFSFIYHISNIESGGGFSLRFLAMPPKYRMYCIMNITQPKSQEGI